MFFGKITLQLSEENRLILPAFYREAMKQPAYITQGFDRNLFLLSQPAFNAMSAHVMATSISDPLARLLSRLFLGSAAEIAMDGLGQILLPSDLCEYAGLGREIIIVGQGEYSEIWSPVEWQKQQESLNDHDANAHRFEKFHVALT